jgi:Mycothiol maleylpyruvate isomerase N-terminal domain
LIVSMPGCCAPGHRAVTVWFAERVNLEALRIAYGDLAALAVSLDEAASWRPTACAGWAVRDLVHHLLGDTQRALVALATPASGPADLVATQGHVLSVDDLLATLVVEATIHHLDMTVDLDSAGPRPEPVAITRATLDALLGRPTPEGWDSEQWVRAATGRAELTDEQRSYLGSDADRLPLLR